MFQQRIDMESGGFGHGMPHQDYDPPQAHNTGITFSRVNRTRPRRCSQQNNPAPGIVRRVNSFYATEKYNSSDMCH